MGEAFTEPRAGFPESMPREEVEAMLALSDTELESLTPLLPWAYRWGVSFDWLLTGDVKPLIRETRAGRGLAGYSADPVAEACAEWKALEDEMSADPSDVEENDPRWDRQAELVELKARFA